MLTDDGWTTDDGQTPESLVYYQLTNQPSAQVSLKSTFQKITNLNALGSKFDLDVK